MHVQLRRTLKKLFKAIGVETHTVAFDSAKYAKDDLGNEIRAACQEKTGVPTFPQVHIGGKFFGGAFDAVKAWKANELQPLIEAAGAKPETCTIDGCLAPWNGYKGDCFDFLPKYAFASDADSSSRTSASTRPCMPMSIACAILISHRRCMHKRLLLEEYALPEMQLLEPFLNVQTRVSLLRAFNAFALLSCAFALRRWMTVNPNRAK